MLFIPVAVTLLTFMFLSSGFHKLFDFRNTYQGFAKKFKIAYGLAALVIALVIFLEIAAPLGLTYYTLNPTPTLLPLARLATVGLIVFTILCNVLYHWPAVGKDYYAFMSNVSTIGGLGLLLYCCLA